jgi:hypothetical protein
VGTISNTIVASALVASGPIVIDGQQDVVISGLHVTNPAGSCIEVLNGSSNIVIENSEIGPCGEGNNALTGFGINIGGSSNITIRNNYIHDTWQSAIWSDKAHHIAVDKNVIINTWSGYKAWSTSDGYLSFTNNFVKNLAPGSYTRWEDDVRGSGDVVQLLYANGPAIRITDNVAINIAGESNPEDLVNLWQSSGKASDPILVARNKFNGGQAPSAFGILLGDGWSPDVMGWYATAEDNILVNTGSGGVNIAGGGGMTVRNNKIYGDVKDKPYPNVGLGASGDCSTHTVEYNEVTFYKGANWNNTGNEAYLSPSYLPSGCSGIAGWSTNKFDTESSQPAKLDMSVWNPAWDTPSFLPDNPYHYSTGAQ